MLYKELIILFITLKFCQCASILVASLSHSVHNFSAYHSGQSIHLIKWVSFFGILSQLPMLVHHFAIMTLYFSQSCALDFS